MVNWRLLQQVQGQERTCNCQNNPDLCYGALKYRRIIEKTWNDAQMAAWFGTDNNWSKNGGVSILCKGSSSHQLFSEWNNSEEQEVNQYIWSTREQHQQWIINMSSSIYLFRPTLAPLLSESLCILNSSCHIQVHVDFFFELNLLPPYSHRLQGDDITHMHDNGELLLNKINNDKRTISLM